MDVKRARRVLLVAFAISLLLHAAGLVFVRWPNAAPPVPPQYVTLDKRVVIRVTHATPRPLPTSRPTPIPTARPPARPRRRFSPRPRAVPRLARTGSKASSPARSRARSFTGAAAVQTRTPVPFAPATPAAACPAPNAAAAVASTPAPPEIPANVRAAGTTGTAAVDVKLDAAARVTAATLVASSGNSGLDELALQMARSAAYTPQYVACKAVAGDVVFTVRFVAW